MTQRYKNYTRNKFEAWKRKVKAKLPELAIAFYSAKLNGKYISYEKEKLLGAVIREINNPNFAVTNDMGKPIDETDEIAMQVILEIWVEEIFSFVNTTVKQQLQ